MRDRTYQEVDYWERFADGWPEPLFVIDAALCLRAVNPAGRGLLGIEGPLRAGATLRELNARVADALEPALSRALDEGRAYASNLRLLDARPFGALAYRVEPDLCLAVVSSNFGSSLPGDEDWGRAELAYLQGLLGAYTDNTTLGYVRCNEDHRIIAWSPRAAEIFGYTFDQVRGRTFAEVGMIHPDDLARVEDVLGSLADGGSTMLVENRNVRSDGSIIHCRWFNSRIPLDGTHQLVSIADDVTSLVTARADAQENEQRFRSIFEYSPDPMLALSLEGVVTRANDAALRSYGTSDTLVGRRVSELTEDVRMARAAFAAAAAGEASSLELVARRDDGSTFPVLATFIPIVFRDKIAGVHLLSRDLTAIRRAEREIAAQSERVRELYLVAAAANAAAENQIEATIAAGCRLLRMPSGTLYDAEANRAVATAGDPIPHRLTRLALGTDGALALEDLGGLPFLGQAQLGEHPPSSYIGTAIEVAGVRYGSLSFASPEAREEPFSDSDRDLVQLMGALIGSAIERGRSRARLKHLAYNDQLTMLPNRAWFTDRLRDELSTAAESGTRVAVMFLDLDRFKDINDTLGHALGDRLLRVIGDRLTAVVGDAGVVSRMGGDEFIVLVSGDAERDALESLAQRIIAAIDQPLIIDGYEQFVTTSVGIAVYPSDGGDADTLIKHADVAMYRAKDRGRNTFQFFTPALGASLRTRISQEKSLRKALDRDEFIVYYQPQFSLEDQRLVALEALVRWRHPRLGLVAPDQFIPSAEMSGLIVPLGDFVLETACRQMRAWQDVAPGLRLAVNLSARQFHQTALATKVTQTLARNGLPPNDLEIEITESVAMSDAALSVQILRQLGDAGIRLAVDDFGTGYSSLSYLRRFPLDSLKIDREFVRDIMDEPDDATIVKTVIAMAHSLGLEVCAEGVETADQLDFLRAQRCDRAQGFLFARPMAADDLSALLHRREVTAAAG